MTSCHGTSCQETCCQGTNFPRCSQIQNFVPGQHDPERHQLGSERGGPSTHPEQVLRTCRGSATGHHQETGLNRFVSPPIPYWLNSNIINKWSNSHPLFNSSSQSRSSWASEMDIFDAFKINLLSIDDETRNKNSVAHSHLFSLGHASSEWNCVSWTFLSNKLKFNLFFAIAFCYV